MDDLAIQCPYCGEINDFTLDPESKGVMVQDCQVCCQPIELEVRRDAWNDPVVSVRRES